MFIMNQEKQIIQIKFGVPFFDMYDYQYNNFSVPVAIRGAINFKIKSYKKLVNNYGYNDDSFTEFQTKIRTAAISYSKQFVMELTNKHEIPVMQIERYIGEFSNILKKYLTIRIKKEFNIFVSFIDITAMEIDKISDGYRNLKAITQDVMLATVQAETQAKIKKIVMEQDAEIENYAKLLEIDREEIKNNPKLKKVVRLTALFGIIAVGAIIVIFCG